MDKNYFRRQAFVIGIISICFIVFSSLAYSSEDPLDPEESTQHYLLTHELKQHPDILFIGWQRPLFSILSYPFATNNFEEFKFFNILLVLGTSYITYSLARLLKKQNSYIVLIFTIFSPMYFGGALSGLTEILFSFLLISAIYLYINKRFTMSLIVISFLPFARQEGFVVILIMFLLLLLEKRYKYIPILFLGSTLFYATAYVTNHGIMWYFNGYWGNTGKYGMGSLFFFFNGLPAIFGAITTMFIVTAGFLYIAKSIRFFRENIFSSYTNLLIPIIFSTYLVMYSVFTWKGYFATMELLRYMNTVVPLGALIALDGFNFLNNLLPWKKTRIALTCIIIAIIVLTPFKQFHFPIKESSEKLFIREFASWFKSFPDKNKQIYACNVNIRHFLNIDLYNSDMSIYIHSIETNTNNNDDFLLIWDRTCLFDFNLNIDSLLNNTKLRLLSTYPQINQIDNYDQYKKTIYIFLTTQGTTSILQ
jgi:hypothetical protein